MSWTQMAAVPNETEVSILVKFKANKSYAGKIASFLGEVRERTEEDEKKLNKMRVAQVGKADAFAYKRELPEASEGKLLLADTGTEMFYNGEPGNCIKFAQLPQDLANIGYKLCNVYSFQKTHDVKKGMFFICFEFRTGEANTFPEEVTALLGELCQKTWEHAHIWNNLNNAKGAGITINAAKIVIDDTVAYWDFNLDQTGENMMLIQTKKAAPEEGIYFTLSDEA